MTMIIVEQGVERGLALADRVYVMEEGNVALAGTPAELGNSPLLHPLYLGEAPQGEESTATFARKMTHRSSTTQSRGHTLAGLRAHLLRPMTTRRGRRRDTAGSVRLTAEIARSTCFRFPEERYVSRSGKRRAGGSDAHREADGEGRRGGRAATSSGPGDWRTATRPPSTVPGVST